MEKCQVPCQQHRRLNALTGQGHSTQRPRSDSCTCQVAIRVTTPSSIFPTSRGTPPECEHARKQRRDPEVDAWDLNLACRLRHGPLSYNKMHRAIAMQFFTPQPATCWQSRSPPRYSLHPEKRQHGTRKFVAKQHYQQRWPVRSLQDSRPKEFPRSSP